jgi:hypothetical protein
MAGKKLVLAVLIAVPALNPFAALAADPTGGPEQLQEIVVTAQKRQPRVHTSPSSMMVAVPSAQHSPTCGHVGTILLRVHAMTQRRPRRAVDARRAQSSSLLRERERGCA